MKKPNKPMTMIYAEAKADFTMAIRNISKAYGLPLFLMAEITGEIASNYKKEAMNELAADSDRFARELEEYYECKIRELDAEKNMTPTQAQEVHEVVEEE